MSLSDAEKLRRLERALDYAGPTHRVADVVELVKQGRAQIWECDDGCIVSEIHDYPLRKDVHFWLISGSLHDCLALEERIVDWALSEGCTMATAAGRRGWGRVAAPTGWREHLPTFCKPLSGGKS